jgi:hypothetical protein
MFRVLPPFGGDPRGVAEVVNGIMNGKTNNTGTVTLATGGATSTTITDARIGVDSVILLCPTSAVSAAYQFPHGSFQDTTNQTISSTTTAYAMTFNTTDFAEFVSVASNSRITVQKSGVYDLQFSSQFVNTDSAIQDIDIWIRKNGTDIPLSRGSISIPNRHGSVDGRILPSWNYLLQLAANDYVEIMWSATSTTVSMTTIPTDVSPTRPAAASVIATVNHVSCDGFTSNLFTLPFISSVTNGSAVISHPANSIAGKTFDYIVVG